MATTEELINPTSMDYWYPKIQHLDIPIPKTELILTHKNPTDWWGFLNNPKLSKKDQIILHDTARQIGYPLFMRNSYTSGKHNYEDTCFVLNEDVLEHHLYRVIEDAVLHDQLMTSLILREYIELDSQFKAFKGLPMAPERRIFVSSGMVLCHHPYWVLEAIRFSPGTDPVDNWEDMLIKMNEETDDEIALLSGYAEKIATILEGAWSLDFAKSRSGLWYFIDAAEAKKSWHPSGCKNCLEGRGEKKKKKNSKKQPFPLWYDKNLFLE